MRHGHEHGPGPGPGPGHGHGEHGHGRGKHHHHHHGAQTFRRGRALEFLQRLTVKRATLLRQLDTPEFQDIRPTVLGELKAVEAIIDEYTQHFDIHQLESDAAGAAASDPSPDSGVAPDQAPNSNSGTVDADAATDTGNEGDS
ncbi:hypothetical protein [Paenibacillus sp. OV219]|uniref:hypothetical protein n=1 Tax=Paenibacillus sp. OV219 TaxID=1884377 RepID=UPI0008CAF71D|nr:hypothetical protein [Paenibacillus sp. OV219]SEN52074.1 hypothetical protein SAMN05518847_103121 [Paenibacillus sp. OV219]